MIAFKTFELCPSNQKPDENIPRAWPWEIVEINENESSKFISSGYTVLNVIDYNSYISSIQNQYNAWRTAYDVAREQSIPVIKSKVGERRVWCESLIEDIKTLNTQLGLNLSQSVWFHSRARAMSITVLQSHADVFSPLQGLVGMTLTIDLLNLVISGDVETAYGVLICVEPDDMSQPYHCFSAQLIQYIQMRIAQYLGWA